MKRRYAILDFDGVVADTETVFAEFDCALLNTALRQAGKEERLSIAQTRSLAGMSGENKLIHIAQKYGFNAQTVEQAFIKTRKKQRKHLFKKNKIRLGKNLLPFIKKYPGRIALATNKQACKLQMDTSALKLDELFDIIITCDPPLKPKPAPDILLMAAKKLNTHAHECLYIGDNPNDMIAATAADMLPLGFIISNRQNESIREKVLRDSGAKFIYDDFADIKNHME